MLRRARSARAASSEQGRHSPTRLHYHPLITQQWQRDDDVHDPEGWANDALCLPESRNRFRRMLYLGLTDAYRMIHTEPHKYSFWDYQRGAWQKDFGVRIDHLLLSPQAADRLKTADIDRGPRGKEKASDHTPVWCELE